MLEFKEYPEDWSSARSLALEQGQETVTAKPLNPGSTYNFRLALGDTRSDELVVDTQCTSTHLVGFLIFRSAELHTKGKEMFRFLVQRWSLEQRQ